MRIGSLFSGYGGLDMAVQSVVGGTVTWVSDIDPGPAKILAHHWPDVPNLRDITQVDFAGVGPVDVLTGGFPCQDVSHAGRRQGLIRDGDGATRSGLWGEMLRTIDQLRPSLVVAENVRGLLNAQADSDVEPCPWCLGDPRHGGPMRALGAVLADLADLGYDAAWCGLRAADVGAPHGRFRVFITAWPAADTERVTDRPARRAWPENAGVTEGEAGGASGRGSDTAPLNLLPTPEAKLGTSGPDYARQNRPGTGGDSLHEAVGRLAGQGPLLPTPNTSPERPMGKRNREQSGTTDPRAGANLGEIVQLLQRFGDYGPAIARWEHVLGRPAPAPTEPTGKNGAHRLSPAFVEWLMGLPEGHVTDVPGLTRNAQLKALGNGVVPQQATAALTHLLAQERTA